MKKPLMALLGGLALACGGGGARFKRVAALNADLAATVIIEVDAGAAVVFGYTGGAFTALDRRQVAVLRVGVDGAVNKTEPGAGWIVAAAAGPGAIWAARASLRSDGEGSNYALLVSQDGGRHWTEAGPIPAASLTALAVEGAGRGWALGVQTLLHTVDGGRTWTAVSAPLFLRGVAQGIAAPGPGVLVLGGAGLVRTTDAGQTWTRLADDDVSATDGSWVVARGKGYAQVGRIAGDSVNWTGRIDESVQPDAVRSDGERLRIRAAPLGRDAGRRVLLFESTDQGVSFQRQTVGDSGDPNMIALGGEGRTWRLDLSRRLSLRD